MAATCRIGAGSIAGTPETPPLTCMEFALIGERSRQGRSPMRLDKFTVKSQEAIQSAAQLAERNGNTLLEPEHVLLALIEQGEDGVVAPVLSKIGARPELIKDR